MRKTLILVTLAVVIAAAAIAESPFHETLSGPRALPSDRMPPFGMLDDAGHLPGPPPLPPGVHLPGPHSPPETTAPSLSMDDAVRAVRAAVNFCSAAGYHTGGAVVDAQGEARAMMNADGADGSHVFVGMRKAEVSVVFGMSSAHARDAIAKEPALLKRVTPAMFVEGGALPIWRFGKLIGAIGVSGAAGTPIGHQDEVCAMAGLRGLRQRR
jgi:uncharacterized protein GlcG (DUF336 family)